MGKYTGGGCGPNRAETAILCSLVLGIGSGLGWIALGGWDNIDYSEVPAYATWLMVFFTVTLGGNGLDTLIFICYGRKRMQADPVGEGFAVPIWVLTIALCVFQVIWFMYGIAILFGDNGIYGIYSVYGYGSLQFNFAVSVFVLQSVLLILAFLAVVSMMGFAIFCGEGPFGCCCSSHFRHQWCFECCAGSN